MTDFQQIHNLKPQRRNANKHSQRGMGQLETSVQADGWIGAITVAADGETFDGSARIEMAAAAGFDDAIVVVSDGSKPLVHVRTDIPSADDPRAIRLGIAANRVAQVNLEWDMDVLADLGQDIDLSAFWTKDELAALIVEDKTPGGGGDDFDTTPDEGPTRVQPGEMWQLGRHRLLCGDSTKREDIERLMDGEQFDLCFTSPPYTDQREYGLGAFDWHALMCGAFDQMIAAAAGGAHILVNLGLSHKNRQVDMYWSGWLDYAAQAGWPLFGWYVWDKGFGLPGDTRGRLASSHEFVFHFNVSESRANKWVKTTGRQDVSGGFRQKDGTVKPKGSLDKIGQDYKVPDSVIRITREMARGEHTDVHPAVFPVEFPEFGISTWSSSDDIVYEPFAGSGTTLIACERRRRQCRMIEIEPRYCDVILKRFEAESGLVAERID